MRAFAGVFVLALLALGPTASGAEGRVYGSPEQVEPLQPGSRAPAARIRSVEGEAVDLAGLVRDQGALLVFYRGGW